MVTLKNDDVVEGRGNGAIAAAGSARGLVDGLVSSGALDSLFERIDRGDVELTGDGGLIPELVRAALERGLDAETTSHLGYAPGDREGKTASGSTNSRNGSYPKTLATEGGPVRRIAADQSRSGMRTRGHVPLRDGIQAQPVQAKQDTTIERARLNTKPRGFLHFFDHTPNQTARPIHTPMRRAAITHHRANGRRARQWPGTVEHGRFRHEKRDSRRTVNP